MMISLYKGKVEGTFPGNKIGFEKMLENSFHEWSSSEDISKEMTPWSLTFKIEDGSKEEFFYVDTHDEYLAYLDLDGYLQGQMLELDEERELKIVSKNSYMYELICFSEVLKSGVLDLEKIEILESQIFPEWANGIVADDLETNEIVTQFMEIFAPVLDELGVLKKVSVSICDFEVEADTDSIKKEFVRYIEEYVGGEIFFLVHNPMYTELYPESQSKLFEAARKFLF